ncbi:hypothetical protein HY479_04245 [Candidatus Uhrbacteria bacterium]|nr:hypothetical protein [Candidatus Uhrbacteria bacterium]
MEHPERALAALQHGQRELADQFEAAVEGYERTLQDLALRLSSLKPEELRREVRALRDVHDGLRRILRRIEASMRSSREIERELTEWQAREDERGPLHADHPRTRAEILRSELAVRRELPLSAISPETSPFASDSGSGVEESIRSESPAPEPDQALPSVAPEHLLRAIMAATREVDRWHASPEVGRDAVDDLQELRKLHAVLKRLDREQGVRRDRIELAVRARETY